MELKGLNIFVPLYVKQSSVWRVKGTVKQIPLENFGTVVNVKQRTVNKFVNFVVYSGRWDLFISLFVNDLMYVVDLMYRWFSEPKVCHISCRLKKQLHALYMVTLVKWTPTFEWKMTRLAHTNEKCYYDNIGLCAQNTCRHHFRCNGEHHQNSDCP